MKIFYSDGFEENLKSFPIPIRKKFYKQVSFLLNNLRHPSLDAKKYDESRGIWQARIDRKIRFYFLIKNDAYILIDIIKHPK